jgi:hypothetical protein
LDEDAEPVTKAPGMLSPNVLDAISERVAEKVIEKLEAAGWQR